MKLNDTNLYSLDYGVKDIYLILGLDDGIYIYIYKRFINKLCEVVIFFLMKCKHMSMCKVRNVRIESNKGCSCVFTTLHHPSTNEDP